jgi:hypothetical protein
MTISEPNTTAPGSEFAVCGLTLSVPDNTKTLAGEQDRTDHQKRHAPGHPGRSFELPATLHRGGFHLELVERRGDRAIYRQIKAGKVVSLEAIIIKRLRDRLFPDGTVGGAGEAYPSDCEWSRCAWTCTSLARAYERLGWDQPLTNHS